MKTKIIIGLALLIAGVFTACEKEYFKPTSSISDNTIISFSKMVVPVLTTKCAISGCHQGAVPPNFSESTAYTNLVDGALVDTLNPTKSILYVKLTSNMPPTGKLTADDLKKFLLWIKQGAQEN
jgi:hypothetical protein